MEGRFDDRNSFPLLAICLPIFELTSYIEGQSPGERYEGGIHPYSIQSSENN